ncbi:MAG: hypothetical protein QXS21_05555 [Thermoproteota archaeon]
MNKAETKVNGWELEGSERWGVVMKGDLKLTIGERQIKYESGNEGISISIFVEWKGKELAHIIVSESSFIITAENGEEKIALWGKYPDELGTAASIDFKKQGKTVEEIFRYSDGEIVITRNNTKIQIEKDNKITQKEIKAEQ